MAILNRSIAADAKIDPTKFRYVVEAKTAAYVLVEADLGKVFTNRGAVGEVEFTLPTVTAALSGAHVRFCTIADQNLKVSCATSDSIVTLDDAAADNVTFGAYLKKTGGSFLFICDGTSWLCLPAISDGQTISVAT